MGAGRNGAYSGTRGGSQPYAETYHVVDEMLREDKKDPDIYDPKTGYFKNPSAISLREAIKGNSIFQKNGKKAVNKFMYVMTRTVISYSVKERTLMTLQRTPRILH